MGQRELATRANVSSKTIAAFELGERQPYDRTLDDIREALEAAGARIIDAVEGDHGQGVAIKWGVTPAARQPGEGTAAGEAGEGGLKAACWDDFDEDADLDALLGEQPAPNPDMAEMWRADPELWARLSEGGRETLSRSMFGDCRAANEGYFREQL
jgi:transcriptional regulator with XRE-family HTH domain